MTAAMAQQQEPTEPAEPLKPQWVVVDRQVLAEMLKLTAAASTLNRKYDDLFNRLVPLHEDVEQGRCTLLTRARWDGEGDE